MTRHEGTVWLKEVEILDDENGSGHSVVVTFSRKVDSGRKEVLFTAEALFALAEERAAEYEARGKGDYEGLAVTLEDLDDEEEEEGEVLPDPLQDGPFLDVKGVENKKPEA